MEKVLGIGGLFFKSPDPKALSAWYRDNLGFDVADWGGAHFEENEASRRQNSCVWAPFGKDSNHFDPGTQPWMVNFRVDDLDAMLAQLRANGCWVDERVEESEFGRFGWTMDPDGCKVELWEPPLR